MALYIGDTLISGTVEGQQLNLPFSLFEYQFTDHVLNNASWLRADTFSWQSGAVYVSAYGKLVEEYATGTTQTEDGITYKLTTNGFKIADSTQESAIASLFNSTGKAWFYILDTANQRFKLPRELPFDGQSKGNGNTLGLTDGGANWGLQAGYTGSSQWYLTAGLGLEETSAGSSGNALYKSANNTLGISTDPTKSGIISNRATTDSVKYLYFYVGETVSNANLIDAGAVTDFVSSLQEVHCVIETYVNDTSWYRVYDDGWCEQGGIVSSVDYYNPKTISFAKTFSDTNYCLSITCKTNSNQVVNANTTLQVYNYSDSQANVFNVSTTSINAYWRACGYLADGEY